MNDFTTLWAFKNYEVRQLANPHFNEEAGIYLHYGIYNTRTNVIEAYIQFYHAALKFAAELDKHIEATMEDIVPKEEQRVVTLRPLSH